MNQTATVSPPAHDASSRVSRRWLVSWAIVVSLMYALLWSPNWYPLSDSSLYLAMGRSWALGRGLTVQGQHVDLVPPIVPLMFGLIMKRGHGIGTIQAVLITFLLLAHALSFLALRRWVGERLALAAVLAGAASYWVFYNAATIMTEPVAMAFAWGGMWALAGAKIGRPRGWGRAALAGGLFLAASLSRDAAVLLLPGAGIVMWAQNRGASRRAHAVWLTALLLMFGLLLAYRVSAKYQLRGERDPFLVQSDEQSKDDDDEAEGSQPALKPGKAFKVMHGVPRDWRLATEPPMLLGRWVSESLVGPTVAIFNAKPPLVRAMAYVIGFAAAVLFVLGAVWWWRRGGFWAAIPLLYLLPIWAQWGARLKPRYMGPVAPMLLLVMAGGVVALLNRIAHRQKPRLTTVASALTTLVILANFPAWAVEAYVRRQHSRDFYDVARQGATAALVDIGAYLQKHAARDDTVWFNRGAERRVAHYLAGRRLLIRETHIKDWNDSAAAKEYLDSIPPHRPMGHRLRR